MRLPIARDVGRDALNAFVSGEIRGELRVGRIDELSTEGAVARHVELFDPYGNRVAVADRVVLTFDLDAARAGTLRFSSAHLTGGTIRLIESPNEESTLPTFIETFESARPGPSTGEPLHAIVDGMLVEDTVIYGSLLGLDGLRVEDVRLTGRLEATDSVEIRVYSGDGNVVEPFPFVGDVETLSALIDTDPTVGLSLHAGGRIEREMAPDDVVAVNVEYRLPQGADPETGEPELHILVHGSPMHARFLEEVGYTWAEQFRDDAQLDGYFRLRGPVDDLEMRAWAMTSGGHLQLVGGIDEAGVDVTAITPGLDVAEVVEGWPEVHVAGRGRMQIETAVEDAPARIRIEGEPFLYQGFALPAFVLEGEVHDDHMIVTDVDAPYSGGEVHGSGRYDFDGAIDVHVEGNIPQIARDPNIRRYVPDARGGLALDVHLVTGETGDPTFRLDGVMTLRNFVYGPFTADRLRLRGWVGGHPSRPSLHVNATGSGAAVAGYPLGSPNVNIAGGPTVFEAEGRFERGANRQLAFDATVTRDGRTFVLDAPEIEFAIDEGMDGGQPVDEDRVWRGRIERLVWDPDRSVEARAIHLASGSQRLEASGTWRFRGPEEIRAQLQDFDLAALSALVGPRMPPIEGRLDTQVEITGDISAPNIVVNGFLREGTVYGVPDVTALYAIAYEYGNLTVDGQIDLGDRGTLMLSGTGLVDASLPAGEAIENGIYEMELGVNEFRIAVLRGLAGENVPEVDGLISGTITFEGPVFAPELSGSLNVPELLLPGLDPVGLATSFTYENGVLVGRATASDDRGELAETEGSLVVDLVNLVENTAETIESLESLPWRVSVRSPGRQLGQLPPSIAAMIPEELHPLNVSVSGTFAGGAFDTRGDLIANLVWEGDPRDVTCEGGTNPRAIVQATLAEGTTTATARGFVGSEQVLRVEARAPTPVSEWLTEARIPAIPEVELRAFVQNAPTRKIPLVCEIADGNVTAALEVHGLFGEAPRAEMEIHSASVNLLETQPVRLDASARYRDGELVGEGNLSWWSGERAQVELHLPIAWGGEDVLPRVREDEEVLFEGRFDAAPLGPFIAWLPQIEHVSGYMDGSVRATGLIDELSIHGSVEVYEGYLELVGLGQHLTDVTGGVDFEGNWAQLRSFRAWDGEGLLRIDGGIGLDGYRPARARLALNADEFPVRQEGTVLATLTGNATLIAAIGEDRTDMELDVHRLNVRLPEAESRSVQELEPHPDIVIVGRDVDERAEEEPYTIYIDVDAMQPFWVRRNDFSILVAADLQAMYRDPDLRVRGNIELRRGFFEVFGKRFVLDRGSMAFDGGDEIDPQVIMVATHELRQPANTLVTVTVTGTLTEPDVEFRSNHPECDDRSEIITMLISGRCDLGQAGTDQNADAADQAAGVLAGIAAGVLTLSLRRELGDVLPVIVVESGDQGRSGRIRAGFDATSAIPDFLRGVVRGAYFEGMLGGTAAGEGGDGEEQRGGVNPGFLLELQFPYDLVLTGEIETVTGGNPAGRLDFTWEP